jgi:hypothetical protein
MQRSALERLPRTTDIFEPPASTPSNPASPASAVTGAANAVIDPVAAGYYPPLPIAVNRDDLPEVLRTLLWGWAVVARLGRRGTEVAATSQMHAADRAEVRTQPFAGDARAAVHLLLALEGRAGAYGLEEQRRLVELLDAAGVVPDEETNRLVTGGKPFAPAVRRYVGLPQVLQDMVAGERLDLKTAERLRAYPVTAAAAGERTAGLSFSNRRRFFTMLWEIAQRDALGDDELSVVVSEAAGAGATKEGGTASANPDRDPLPALRKRRYPTLSTLEARFEEISGRALAGSGVRLSPPPNFEGSRFTVEFTFDSRRELEKRVEAISELEDEVDELFSLL